MLYGNNMGIKSIKLGTTKVIKKEHGKEKDIHIIRNVNNVIINGMKHIISIMDQKRNTWNFNYLILF